jgi:hypothetical protein
MEGTVLQVGRNLKKSLTDSFYIGTWLTRCICEFPRRKLCDIRAGHLEEVVS